MKTAAIYCIQNKLNGKRYIGQTVDIVVRWRNHRTKLRHGKHDNPYLQKAWIKYGETNFVFSVLEPIDDLTLLPQREGHYCTLFRVFDRRYGYNIEIVRPDGYRHLSEDGRRKVGDFHRGKPKSKEHRARIAASHFGISRPHTDETRKKMSESRKGADNHRFGVRMSEETKAKLSAAKVGKKRGFFRKCSDATRAKISASAKARWARKGNCTEGFDEA